MPLWLLKVTCFAFQSPQPQPNPTPHPRIRTGTGHLAINIEAICAATPEARAHSPSQMPLSCLVAHLSQRELHKDGGGSGGGDWRGEEGARRPGPEGQFLHHALRHALRNALRNVLRRVLDVLVLHVSPKDSAGGGGR